MSSDLPRASKADLAAIHERRPSSVAARCAADVTSATIWPWEVSNADRLRDRLRARLAGRERKHATDLLVENVDRLSRRLLIVILDLLERPDPKNRLGRRGMRRG